jgi:hypothetical protein
MAVSPFSVTGTARLDSVADRQTTVDRIHVHSTSSISLHYINRLTPPHSLSLPALSTPLPPLHNHDFILSMTIPPNDAFTLTSHSDSTPSLRSSRSRSLTRSPSPKIAFTTSQHVANNDIKRRPSRRHRKSSSFVSEPAKLANVDEALERVLNGNGHANGIARQDKTIVPAIVQVKKIDWEIPRKALHSSIGMSRDTIVHLARSFLPSD